MSEPTIIKGGCHCGNIKYQYEVDKSLANISVRVCTCSFCTKLGAIYTSDPEGALSLKIDSQENIKKYQFASKCTEFIFCARCGVMPLSTTVIDGKRFVLINLRTSDKKLHGLSIQTMDFSGESIEESIQRRKSNWIPIVDSL